MNQYGYLIMAYLATAGLYGGYLLILHRRERALSRLAERRSDGRVR